MFLHTYGYIAIMLIITLVITLYNLSKLKDDDK